MKDLKCRVCGGDIIWVDTKFGSCSKCGLTYLIKILSKFRADAEVPDVMDEYD